jgi:hypothetical protein
MSRIIKDLNSFSHESELNEEFNWGNALSSVMGIAGTGFQKTIKEKIAAVILEKIGILEDTILSQIVQEVVDQIPFKDYPAILTGEKANVEYLAPKMTQAITEFFERRGLDPIAQQIGIDPKGWLYSTIRNGLQSPQGKEKLKSFFIEAFGGKDAKGSVARDAFSDLPKADKDKISDEVEKKLSTMYGKPIDTETAKPEESNYFSDFLKSFSGTK